MKQLINIFAILLFTAAIACNSTSTQEQSTQRMKKEKLDSIPEKLPEMSVYNLPATWTNQDGEEIELKDLRGDVIVMVMIYTSCKAACPRLVADMRNIHKHVPAENNKNVKYVMVSIDPEVDTPERLKKFSIDNKMDDTDQWMFLRGSESDTREFAAVLAVSYKAISPIDFSHSNIISVFDKNGVLVHQEEGLGVDSEETINVITQLTST